MPAGLQVLVFAMPRLQGVILERAPIGETDPPWFGPGQAVDCIQMGCGHSILLTARQEYDARYCRGHVTTQAAQCSGRDVLHAGLMGTLLAGDDQVGLQQHSLQPDPVADRAHRIRHVGPFR